MGRVDAQQRIDLLLYHAGCVDPDLGCVTPLLVWCLVIEKNRSRADTVDDDEGGLE